MSRILRSRPSPGLVVACIALFVSLGGVSYGIAGSRGVKADDIATRAVGKRAIRAGGVGKSEAGRRSVGRSELRNNTVNGAEVANDTLGGNDIDESTLGTVPNATNANSANSANSAGNANTVGGAALRPFEFRAAANTAQTTILNLGGLQLLAACNAGGDLDVQARTTVNGSTIGTAALDTVSPDTIENEVNDSAFNVGDNHNVLTNDDNEVNGRTEYMSANNTSVSVTHRTEDDGPNQSCEFTGYAVQTG